MRRKKKRQTISPGGEERRELEAICLTRESEWRNKDGGLAREQRGSTVRGVGGGVKNEKGEPDWWGGRGGGGAGKSPAIAPPWWPSAVMEGS